MGTRQISDPEAYNVWSSPATWEWRITRVKKALGEGKCATTLYGVGAPEMVDFIGQFGFEAIWLEMEHTPAVLSLTDIAKANMYRACDLWGISSVVRVPNDPWVIQRVLDSGADVVAVPHVRTKEAAEAVVRAPRIPRRPDIPAERPAVGYRPETSVVV